MLFRIALKDTTVLKAASIIRPRFFSLTTPSFERKYTKDHEWIELVAPEGSEKIALVGITDYAQKALGDVVYAEVVEPGNTISAKGRIGSVESVKAASDVYSPVNVTIIEPNKEIISNPSLINEDPYGKGWIAKVKLADTVEFKNLLNEEDYNKHIEGL